MAVGQEVWFQDGNHATAIDLRPSRRFSMTLALVLLQQRESTNHFCHGGYYETPSHPHLDGRASYRGMQQLVSRRADAFETPCGRLLSANLKALPILPAANLLVGPPGDYKQERWHE